jgi:hypothetical protein
MQNGHVWGGKMKPPPGIKVYKKGEKAMINRRDRNCHNMILYLVYTRRCKYSLKIVFFSDIIVYIIIVGKNSV